MRTILQPLRTALFAAALLCPGPVLAVDPPYQAQMERLAQAMGSLYFLQPLCGHTEIDWRDEMAELIALDEPDPDRESRLAGAFNAGYAAYARFYRSCTESAREAMRRLLIQGEEAAREIHSRYAE